MLQLRRALVVNTQKADENDEDNIPAHFRVAKKLVAYCVVGKI